MDNKFEYSDYARGREFVMDKERLLKSADYFRSIKPAESSVVDERLNAKKAKEEAAAKAEAAKAAAAKARAAQPEKNVAKPEPQADGS